MFAQKEDLLSRVLRVFKCSRTKFEVFIVNAFICKVLAP